jgi:long-chain acyl-CoA synthetase
VTEVALRGVDLSPTHYRLLMYLAEGSAPAAALAERLIVSRPSVTTLVDGLVERGLVERIHDKDDRRRVNHTLTDEGHEALRAADDAVAEVLEALAARLSSVDAERALGGLAQILEALDDALAERVQESRQQEALT